MRAHALTLHAACCALLTLTSLQAPAQAPAAMISLALPSHGADLLGVFYLAAGETPHPTAVLLHGFPGYEQNLDLAQSLRAHGWNVLALHYRGSWGVKGDFSFTHSAEDADTEINFVLDPANARKYHIDPRRVAVIGHSMGGFLAASAIAHNPHVAAAVLISAWNIGADMSRPNGKTATLADVAKSLAQDNDLLPLAGTSGETLAREIHDHSAALNFFNLAPAIAPRPVFILTANDGLATVDTTLAADLRKAGDQHVETKHWDTDHSYSGQRAELAATILTWLQASVPAAP